MVEVPPGAQPRYPPRKPKKSPAFLDASFSTYVTPGIISVIYILAMIVVSLFVIFGFLAAVLDRDLTGIAAVPAGIVFLLFLRVGLELTMVVFNMASDLRAVRSALEYGSPPAGPFVAPAWPSTPPPPRAPSPTPPGSTLPGRSAPWSG